MVRQHGLRLIFCCSQGPLNVTLSPKKVDCPALQADLAGKDFTAEKQQVIVISAGNNKALTAKDQERNALERCAAEQRHQHRCSTQNHVAAAAMLLVLFCTLLLLLELPLCPYGCCAHIASVHGLLLPAFITLGSLAG